MGIKDSRAQASITDALFMLIIVSTLAITMAYISLSYGRDVEINLRKYFNEDYASSALRAFLNSSIPRFTSDELETANEVDWLLTKMKEDYANTGTFADDTKILAKRVLDKIMSPRAVNYDYMVYFWTPSDYEPDVTGNPSGNQHDRFVFVYLKITEIKGDKNVERVEYFCEPELKLNKALNLISQSAPNLTSTRVITLLFKRFIPSYGGRESKNVVIFTGLLMWHSVGMLPGLENESIVGPKNLNCVKVADTQS
ncbi:MAG: hypothetical protein QXM75_03120 [Candidatus Diapherotrites archaeon]